MDSVSDNSNLATQLLIELASAPSVEDLLKMLVARSAQSPNVISLQIWLVQKMDGSLQIAAASGKVRLHVLLPHEYLLARAFWGR